MTKELEILCDQLTYENRQLIRNALATKDAEIARLLKSDENWRREWKKASDQLERANERIAKLTTALDDLIEQRDAALMTVRNDSRDITALQAQLTKAEAALRVYRRCCHGRDGCFCTKDAAHYFAAKEKETP